MSIGMFMPAWWSIGIDWEISGPMKIIHMANRLSHPPPARLRSGRVVRLMLLRGRMPISRELPYSWYDTPNLRFTTLVDLEELFARIGLEIETRINLSLAGPYSKAVAEQVVNSVFSAIAEAMKSGDKVTLVGFGTFSVSERAAREGRNPKSGETITIPAKKVVKFKAGSKLVDSVK